MHVEISGIVTIITRYAMSPLVSTGKRERQTEKLEIEIKYYRDRYFILFLC